MSIKNIFEIMTDFFHRKKILYGVIGAYALYAYGYIRATEDLDFVVHLKDQKRIQTYLESLGFETLSLNHAFSNHKHVIGSVKVDIMYVENATAEAIFKATKPALLFKGLKLPVVSMEHLVAMKLFAFHNNPERKKDLIDIEEMLKRNPFNKNSILKHFSKYGMEQYFEEIIKKKSNS